MFPTSNGMPPSVPIPNEINPPKFFYYSEESVDILFHDSSHSNVASRWVGKFRSADDSIIRGEIFLLRLPSSAPRTNNRLPAGGSDNSRKGGKKNHCNRNCVTSAELALINALSERLSFLFYKFYLFAFLFLLSYEYSSAPVQSPLSEISSKSEFIIAEKKGGGGLARD
ncbi:hypothetical protein CEXT_645821 [Caerostris extrusa]|uniref:Uncharacterized protein n=1 Tax=Caerostris extrusa TaxID=172846 RepID=A0AAV4MFS2_CAEEX|nr:hypothetical protein CEXT_645821 [Caerostris extrusa]